MAFLLFFSAQATQLSPLCFSCSSIFCFSCGQEKLQFFEKKRKARFLFFYLFHAFQGGGVPSDLNSEAAFESRRPESGCQPQRLASLEVEREEEGGAE